MAVSIEDLIAQLRQLPTEQKNLVLHAMKDDLTKPSMKALREQSERFWEQLSAKQLIAEQQGKPLGALPEFDATVWPEEESLDDFLDWLKIQRQAPT